MDVCWVHSNILGGHVVVVGGQINMLVAIGMGLVMIAI